MEYITESLHHLTINSCNNSALFQKISTMGLIRPQVPQYYLADRDIHIDNPNNPKYIEAMQLYEYDKAAKAMDAALLLAVQIDEALLNKQAAQLKYKFQQQSQERIWLDCLQHILTPIDSTNIIDKAFLTENRVFSVFNVLVSSVYRGGTEILNARLKNAINSQIELDNIQLYGMQLVHPLDEYTACTTSNISWYEWQSFSLDYKAEIIALFRIKRIVDNHAQDEVQIESERKSKNK